MLSVSVTGRGDEKKKRLGGGVLGRGVEWKSERRVIMYHLSEAFSGIITIH